MTDLNARDAKLVQYLNEAYGKEKQLETALQAHIAMTTRAPYKKRLQEHLKETKAHGEAVARRVRQLGGTAETISIPGPDALSGAAQAGVSAIQKATALAKGPMHAVRGAGEQEKMLKNAKTEFSEEAEEIATYVAIEALASALGDADTVRLARSIRRQEERMAAFLERLIPKLTDAVVRDEIPASLRNGARRSSRPGSSRGRSANGARPARRTSPSRRRAVSGRSSARKGPGSTGRQARSSKRAD